MKKICMRKLGPYFVVLSAYDTSANFHPLTGWMPLAGMNDVDFMFNVRNRSGDLDVKPGIEVAEIRTNRPGSATGASSYISTETFDHVRESLSSVEGSNMWVRFGLLYKLSSGTGLGRAEVETTIHVRQEGEILGSPTFQINPVINSGEVSYHVIGGWSPTLDLNKVMAALIVMDKTGSIETQLAIRTATDVNEPNAWALLEGSWDVPSSGNTERIVTAIDPDTVLSGGSQAASNMYFQLALAVQKTGRATIHVVAAASRS